MTPGKKKRGGGGLISIRFISGFAIFFPLELSDRGEGEGFLCAYGR